MTTHETKASLDLSGRIGELDVMRGLAALGVVVYHFTYVYEASYNPYEATLFQFPLGHYGPHLFFMISGFVIFMTLEKTATALDFIVSRFSRLFPCYWAAVILTYFIVSRYLLMPSQLMAVSAKDAWINLTMMQEWLNSTSIDGVYWTMEAELTFYFLILLVFSLK